ncbi:thermostable carboxypeptidase [Listeria floridensis FSL S10-1187]|uniref:Metal-dependent carboxypeptidase n=1 Tax=Listeria floridensis FSL S10-1187 TaxID=1265817 RepID=A0ABP3B1Y3_9LIST|nr:carboxypeptidase M32 [Listeria floridensis]EUJ32973.1 thermostable carboxypeptidase [Listeria floridensis FSL S10-1187]
MNTVEETKTEFLAFLKKKAALEEALNLVYWDIRTKIPKKGTEGRAEVIGVLSEQIFEMEVSEEMAAFIATLAPHRAELDEITAKSLDESNRVYALNKKIPAKEFRAYSKLVAEAENVWGEARAENDFAKFAPYLEEIVTMKRKFVEYWGYEQNKYDTLLDQYEPGMTVEVLDSVFLKLRDAIMTLRGKMAREGTAPNPDLLRVTMPREKQQTFSEQILTKMGFDFDAGRLDDTIHPFAIGLNLHDVRITTRYDEDNFKMAVFGIIHEGGHAIYEQNFNPKLAGTPLKEGASMGIHESQSLFYEIILGSSFAFWKSNYKNLTKLEPKFAQVPLEDFYRAANLSESSLVRIEADILTYPLHIMIRYELEKALMNGELEVADLKEAWNNKYEEYLGIRPEKDSEGILQDIHWAGGDFGYFPSYALGLIYAAQFFHTMERELPELDQIIESDDYTPIREWLTEHIHQYGKLKKPLEILKDTTGEGLNPDYLIDLLNKRYEFVYNLKS